MSCVDLQKFNAVLEEASTPDSELVAFNKQYNFEDEDFTRFVTLGEDLVVDAIKEVNKMDVSLRYFKEVKQRIEKMKQDIEDSRNSRTTAQASRSGHAQYHLLYPNHTQRAVYVRHLIRDSHGTY